jgi:hypothetical protein
MGTPSHVVEWPRLLPPHTSSCLAEGKIYLQSYIMINHMYTVSLQSFSHSYFIEKMNCVPKYKQRSKLYGTLGYYITKN